MPDGVSVFDLPAPNQEWDAEALHSFARLPALSNAGGDNARRLATNLIGQWIKRHAVYSELAWLPHDHGAPCWPPSSAVFGGW